MSGPVDAEGETFGPWNPGIRSQVPEELLQLSTIFKPENVFTSVAEAAELRDLTGLELAELTVFRPHRLALHELLVRVTANIAVPDGSKIEDLGINFRAITRVILERHVAPQMVAIEALYDACRQRIREIIVPEVRALHAEPAVASALPAARRGLLDFIRRARPNPVPEPADAARGRELRLLQNWEHKARSSGSAVERAAYRSLARVVAALLTRHGAPWASDDLIASLAGNLACNSFASDEIGALIEPLVADAARVEGYMMLPRQEHPVVMNTKGASASGKSTLRPLQKALAGDIGVNWTDFALISPDIWRKQLLDYASLGAAYKYGGAFTGEEVQVIDQKLDRYMARKAERGDMSHLLIDRFRFDSFAADSDEAGSNLLTRFGQTVYLFFMITAPASLVERAWNRGLEVGRYKAVDDTLAHAVEAYSGMPHVFFTWIERNDKNVHFEFLDNNVVQGQPPRTVAFGTNDTLNVLDVKRLLDVERYRKVNAAATSPEGLYVGDESLEAERNTGFLKQCVERFDHVNVADQETGRVYLRLVAGGAIWKDRALLDRAGADPDVRAGLLAMVPSVFDTALPAPDEPLVLRAQHRVEEIQTLGQWGRG
ncbi:MAG: hypothetical protein ABIS17_01525 [Casimicrobiaceae bacterium]